MIPNSRRMILHVAPNSAEAIELNRPKSKIKITVRKIIDKYLENASLHGLHYIGDRSLTIFER